MDLLKFKDSLFAGSSTNIEKVEVNQRHLIDKILARYSAEFTIYRELIQNANDAGANEVQIEVKTTAASSNFDRKLIDSIVIRNNGRAFNEDDWRRLKKIAEGNPDEQKIGFFGVGFYSLFSICEEPLVISGSKCLGFYWNGDQLYTKTAPYAENKSEWTEICLKLRDPIELMNFDEFGQFLCKSLLFTYSLSIATFIVNEKVYLKCTKILSPPSEIYISKFKTASGLFNLTSFQNRLVQMTIEKNYNSPEPEFDITSATSMFSGLWKMAQSKLTDRGKEAAALDSKLRQSGIFHVFLKHFCATASVKTTNKFSDELERTTKKKPFKNINVDLIYINWEQLNATNGGSDSVSGSKVSTNHPILSQTLPFPTKGKVFIGFETHQTSGLGIHLTAPFIPTVERESIDFVDGCLKIWNIELIQLSGRLCRLIYEEELTMIPSHTDPDYLKKAKHLMEAFNFQNSTPAGIISWTLFDEFLKYSCDLKLPSSNGFVSSSFLRHVPKEMLTFVQNTPRIPDKIANECQEVLQKLAYKKNLKSKASNLIATISINDIIDFELKGPMKLNEIQLISCLKWWLKQLADPFGVQLTERIIGDFAAALQVPSAQAPNTFLPLSKISYYGCDELSGLYFSDKAKIKFFPIDCLSPAFSAQFSVSDFNLLLRIDELNIADWLDGIIKWTYAKEAIESDFEKAEQILVFLSKSYNSPPKNLDAAIFQGRICNALSNLKCIPVGNGILKKPGECYFEDVPQLQISMNFLKFSTESRRYRVNEAMLKGSGVLSHLPLDQIFSNIGSLKWDHVSLIKYLVRIKNELTKSDMNKLKSTPLFPDKEDSGIFKLSQLYSESINPEISKILELKNLKWDSGVPREGSEIGEFLSDLGLNYIVPWRLLLKSVVNANPSSRALIFRYFFENFSFYEDYNCNSVDFPFVPVESVDGFDLNVFLPSQVFLDAPLSHLKFYLLHPELIKYSQLLGIKERPSSTLIAEQVINTRLDYKAICEVFAYCGRISNEFSKEDLRLFRGSSFIPCFPSSENNNIKVVYKSFDQVFLPSDSNSDPMPFSNLFDQVDFGVQANSFLRLVGVIDEPRAENLITLLLENSIKIFSQLKPAKYTELMERISIQWANISLKHSKLAKSFIASKSFIGFVKSIELDSHKVDNNNNNNTDDIDEKLQYSLFGISELFLVDDSISHQLFNLPTVPGNLEQFYLKLGCRWVSSVIKSEWKCTGNVKSDCTLVNSTRKLLEERRNLILSSLEGRDGDDTKIIKNGKKRLEFVKLYQVDSIEICRICTLNKETNSQAACAFTDGAAAHPSVYLAKNSDGQFDYFDLASVIVSLLCEKKGCLQDSLLVTSLLTTPLSSLRAKGFQVDTQNKNKEEEIILPKPQKLIEKNKIEAPINDNNSSNSNESQVTKMAEQPLVDRSMIETPKNSRQQQLEQTTPTKKSSRKWSESILGFFKKTADNFSSTESLIKSNKAGEGRDEESLRKALDRGIKSLRPHQPGDFDAIHQQNVYDEPAPKNSNVCRELSSYCQISSSLRFLGKIGTVDIYSGDSLSIEEANNFLSGNIDALMSFYGLIVNQLANLVFKIPAQSTAIHLYYDPESTTVAFNRSHSLFFNFAYFHSNQQFSILNCSDLIEVQRCKSFWFITFCHELAHNFVSEHDAKHEFYLSSFAETFLPEFIKTL